MITLKSLKGVVCKRFDQAEAADIQEDLNGVRKRGRLNESQSLNQDDKSHLRNILHEAFFMNEAHEKCERLQMSSI
jgi:hypothetical protein